MSMKASFKKKDLEKIERKLETVSSEKKGNAVYKGMRLAAADVEAGLKLTVSGGMLKIRSGRLANSIGSRIERRGKNIISVIGSGARRGKPLPYAAIHEKGGTIRPKRAKYLTVPLPAAMTKSGVVRKRAREYRDTFVRKTASRSLILYQKKGNKALPLFALKKSVKIPARKYMSKTLKSRKSRVMEIFRDTVTSEVERA
jgi:phage gpG-like protein